MEILVKLHQRQPMPQSTDITKVQAVVIHQIHKDKA
jgi:hypothetical protein